MMLFAAVHGQQVKVACHRGQSVAESCSRTIFAARTPRCYPLAWGTQLGIAATLEWDILQRCASAAKFSAAFREQISQSWPKGGGRGTSSSVPVPEAEFEFP